jgi:hypothetical protein
MDNSDWQEMQRREDQRRMDGHPNEDYQRVLKADPPLADVKKYCFDHEVSGGEGINAPQIKELKKQIEADHHLTWELERLITEAWMRGRMYECQLQRDKQKSIFPWKWRIGKHEPY